MAVALLRPDTSGATRFARLNGCSRKSAATSMFCCSSRSQRALLSRPAPERAASDGGPRGEQRALHLLDRSRRAALVRLWPGRGGTAPRPARPCAALPQLGSPGIRNVHTATGLI